MLRTGSICSKELIRPTENHSQPALDSALCSQLEKHTPSVLPVPATECGRQILSSNNRRQKDYYEGWALPQGVECALAPSLLPLPLSSPIITSQALYSLPSKSLQPHVPSPTPKP